MGLKYLELLKMFEQSKYNFDIRDELVINEVLEAIDDIDNNLTQNQILINKKLSEIQKNNCFETLDSHNQRNLQSQKRKKTIYLNE